MSAVIRASALDSDNPPNHNVPVAVSDQLPYFSRLQFCHLQNGVNTTCLTRFPRSVSERIKVLVQSKDSINVSYSRDLHCVVREFAWKPESHQRGVTETGKWGEDGKGDSGASKFPRLLCCPCQAESTEVPRHSRTMCSPSCLS